VRGPEASVAPGVEALLRAMADAGKPIGAICIAPALVTRALADRRPRVTIGTDPGTAGAIEAMGGVHEARPVDEICVDADNRLVTTPAYMLGPGVKDVARGIEKLVEKVMAMA